MTEKADEMYISATRLGLTVKATDGKRSRERTCENGTAASFFVKTLRENQELASRWLDVIAHLPLA